MVLILVALRFGGGPGTCTQKFSFLLFFAVWPELIRCDLSKHGGALWFL